MKFDWPLLVKDVRKSLLLSQEEMAKKLGIAFCSINRYENGRYEPTYKVQRKLKKLAISNGLDWNKYK